MKCRLMKRLSGFRLLASMMKLRRKPQDVLGFIKVQFPTHSQSSKMPSSTHPGYRIYLLGAGFSRSAGLPVASELFPLVRAAIEEKHGTDTKFHRDLRNYLSYCADCGVSGQQEESLDLEVFMSYLDIEHYLGLRGGDTWSREGNESQLMIKRAIGEVIHRACADFCVNGIVLKLRNAAFELDGKAVERRLPIMDGKRPFFTDVA